MIYADFRSSNSAFTSSTPLRYPPLTADPVDASGRGDPSTTPTPLPPAELAASRKDVLVMHIILPAQLNQGAVICTLLNHSLSQRKRSTSGSSPSISLMINIYIRAAS